MKRHTTRRDFIRAGGAGLMGIAMTGPFMEALKKTPPLSFSTLGCPDWTFPETVKFAAAHGFKGLEVRGIKREMDLPKCPEFSSPENIRATCKLVKDHGLEFVDLGSSVSLHDREGSERRGNIEDAKRFIDLAEKIKCPFIRVFPNDLPANQERNETLDLISSGMTELGNHAKGSGVRVLMESHGQVVYVEDLNRIMAACAGPNTGLVWDIVNMWAVTKEPTADVYDRLKKYIFHIHIKDLNVVGDKHVYTLLGKGNTPILETLDMLVKDGYKGYYSFEWEKMWHPEIEEPEIALADFAAVMKQRYK